MPDARDDSLALLLRDLRPVGVSYGHCTLARPWGVLIPAEPVARLHLVVRGRALLRVAEAWTELREGDAAFIPRGDRHAVADRPDRPLTPLAEIPTEPIGERAWRLREGGSGAETLMTCCAVTFGEPRIHAILGMMPSLIVVRAATRKDPALDALLGMMAEEVLGDRIGSTTVLARLADVAIVRVLRAWAEAQADTGWLGAVSDPRMARALAAIHAEPGRRWSVAELATRAGMSRSALHAAFARLLRTTPARYAAARRLGEGAKGLEDQGVPIAEAARLAGFASTEAFARAFKRSRGITPGAARSARQA